MNVVYLAELIAACKVNATAENPLGWTYAVPARADDIFALVQGGMVEAGAPSPYGIPLRLTQAALKWEAEAATQPHRTPSPAPVFVPPPTQPAPAQPAPAVVTPPPASAISPALNAGPVQFDDNVPPPEPRNRGFMRAEGGTLIERWGFDQMVPGQSFFVGQEHSSNPERPVHQTFSSTVSAANKKLFPKHFVIQGVDETAAGRGKGARVWRIADATGPAPTRQRGKASPAPNPASGAQTQGLSAPVAVAGGFASPPGSFPSLSPAPTPAPAPAEPAQPASGFTPPGGFGGPPPFG